MLKDGLQFLKEIEIEVILEKLYLYDLLDNEEHEFMEELVNVEGNMNYIDCYVCEIRNKRVIKCYRDNIYIK